MQPPDGHAPAHVGDGAVGAALAWLVHPVTVFATALLIVNDHLLKAAYPGWVTGKLSDVAGLVMAPPVVAVALAWVWPRWRPLWHAGVAVALVGVLFAALKASPLAAGYASAGWSLVNGPSVVLADRTDLLALPALAIAWWTWRSAQREMTLRGWRRLAAVLVVLPVAGLGIAATSAPVHDDAVVVAEWHDRVVVGIGDGFRAESREPRFWLISDNDGRTFRYLSEAESDDFFDDLADRQAPTPEAGRSGCSAVSPRHCFRVVSGRLAVEESRDAGATWQLVWQVREADRARLAGAYPALGDADEHLSSRALVVRDQTAGGVVVLVANGRDGFARRDAAGHWDRIGFGTVVDPAFGVTSPPPPVPGLTPRTAVASIPVPFVTSVALASVLSWVGCTVALVRLGRTAAAKVSAGLLFPGIAVSIWAVTAREEAMPLLAYLAMAAGAGLALCAMVVLVTATRVGGALTFAGITRVGLAGLICGLSVTVPFLCRLVVGWPSQPAATALALGAAGAALVASVPVAFVHANRRSEFR